MKKRFLLILPLIFFYIASANAQMSYYKPSNKSKETEQPASSEQNPNNNSLTSKSLTITPPDKCFTKLSKEEAAEVKNSYMKPYAECQRRLKLKEHKSIVVTPAPQAKEKNTAHKVND